jgi:predicted RNA-binding protein with TRAM domain
MKKNQKMAKNRGKHSLKCPVRIGNEYNVDITAKTPSGPGIARVQGFIVLVKGAQIGENKTIVVTKIGPLNAEAELVS